MATKLTQVQAIAQAIEALTNTDLVSVEIVNKLSDIKVALEKKSGKTSKKTADARQQKYNAVKQLFTSEPSTLTDILKSHRETLDELNICSSQGLLGAIRPGIESGEIVRVKEGKVTTFALAE